MTFRHALRLEIALCVLALAAAPTAGAATDLMLDQGVTLNGALVAPSASDLATLQSTFASPSAPLTVPFWSSSFVVGGVTYPYTMVGTDPSRAGATTVVPTVIIPVDLTFDDVRNGAQATLKGSSVAGAVAASPLFNAAPNPATPDVTQYGDAIQRAEFARVRPEDGYHVLLGLPTITATAHIEVPKTKGYVSDLAGDGISRGFLTDRAWWRAQRSNLIDAYHVTPDQLVVFLTKDTVSGLSIGFHGARLNGDRVQTYIWSSWLSPGWAVPFGFAPDFAQDTMVLGHEVAEWLNDPFINNQTPPWSFSLPPLIANGCGQDLEVGDPLELAQFPVALGGLTYHFQDAAFLSWFARQVPSIGYLGRYSFLGTFTTYSTPC